MDDFILTRTLIQEQERRLNLFAHIETNFLFLLKKVSKKVDEVIERLSLFMQYVSKNKYSIIFAKAIHEEYQQAKNEWNLYLEKIYYLLNRFADGNLVLRDEAQKLYSSLVL